MTAIGNHTIDLTDWVMLWGKVTQGMSEQLKLKSACTYVQNEEWFCCLACD